MALFCFNLNSSALIGFWLPLSLSFRWNLKFSEKIRKIGLVWKYKVICQTQSWEFLEFESFFLASRACRQTYPMSEIKPGIIRNFCENSLNRLKYRTYTHWNYNVVFLIWQKNLSLKRRKFFKNQKDAVKVEARVTFRTDSMILPKINKDLRGKLRETVL